MSETNFSPEFLSRESSFPRSSLGPDTDTAALLSMTQSIAKIGSWEYYFSAERMVWSEEHYKLLGYHTGEVEPGLEILREHIHQEDVGSAMQAWNELRDRGVLKATFRFYRRDSELRYAHCQGQVISDGHGGLKGVGTFQDITQIKRVENKLIELLEQNQSRRKETEALLEGTRAVLEFADFNPAARAIFNSCQKIVGNRAGWVDLLCKDERSCQTILVESGSARGLQSEEQRLQLDGSDWEAYQACEPFCINQVQQSSLASILPARDMEVENILLAPMVLDGKTWGRLALVNKPGGFTEQDQRIVKAFAELGAVSLKNERIEQQLRQSQKMEAIGTLAGGIAHDFNNILMSIIGFTEMGLSVQDASPQMKSYLQRIYQAGQRAKELVNQILTFSRENEQKKEPLQMDLILNEALKFLQATLPPHIQLHADIERAKVMVLADPSQVNQIIMNLCTNASQAMREEGGSIRVSYRAEELAPGDLVGHLAGLRPGRYVRLEVADSGQGIRPEMQERIFEPFFTTKGPAEGSGLGLSVVHGIVKDMDGVISVESEVDKGTTFTVWLPVIRGVQRDKRQEAQPSPVPGKGRVLFVDDEPNIVLWAKTSLKTLGYEVVATENALEALELFKSNPGGFDVVVTDMQMPSLSGKELMQEISAQSPHTPIILCSGTSEALDIDMDSFLGKHEFLQKPYSIAEFSKSLQRVRRKASPADAS